MVWLRSIQTNPRKQIITFDPEGLSVFLRLKSHHIAAHYLFKRIKREIAKEITTNIK
jgi:hypothetical protein